MNKLASTVASAVIAMALAVGGTAAAFADDAVPVDPTPTQEVASSPSTEPTAEPVTEAPAPALESSPAPAAEAPASSPVTDPVAVTPPTAQAPAGASRLLATTIPKLALWEKPADKFGDQYLVKAIDSTSLNALDAYAVPGKCYQADLYVPGAITDALLAGGVLHAPNDPQEALMPGGDGVAYKTWCVPIIVLTTPTVAVDFQCDAEYGVSLTVTNPNASAISVDFDNYDTDGNLSFGDSNLTVPANSTESYPGYYNILAGYTLKVVFAGNVIGTYVHPDCNPPAVVNTVCTVNGDGGTSTDLDANGWGNVDTRSKGHYEYVDGGLHIYTDDASSQAKVSLGKALNIPLKDVGQLSLDYTATTGIKPGLNLFVTFASGQTGTLVYEDVYGQDLWLTNGSSATVKAAAPSHTGGNGSENHGTINEWLSVYPDAQITGFAFSGGSGVFFDGILHSVTVGCNVYSFDAAPTPVAPEDEVTTTTSEGTTDCEAKTVSYTVTTTTIHYTVVNKVIVAGEPVVTTQEQIRDATEAECPTAVVVPPTTPPTTPPTATPSPTPSASPSAERLSLPFTGVDGSALVGWSVFAFLLIAAGVMVAIIRRVRKQQ